MARYKEQFCGNCGHSLIFAGFVEVVKVDAYYRIYLGHMDTEFGLGATIDSEYMETLYDKEVFDHYQCGDCRHRLPNDQVDSLREKAQ